ncbi:hypothetical protein MBLNU459_g0937t1 [Dothideomycetes sp. NU459]
MLAKFLSERKALLSWRIVGMMTLFVLLLVALIPTASNLWAVEWPIDDNHYVSGWAIPARCFWFRTYGTGVNPDAPLGFMLLLVSYMWKIGGLFKSSRGFFHRWVRGVPEYVLETLLKKEMLRSSRRRKMPRTSPMYKLLMGVYVINTAFFEFGASFAASLWLSLLGLVFGTIQIVVPRQENLTWSASVENSWGFGQIVPLVLLIQPLGAVLEHFRMGSKQSHPHRPNQSDMQSLRSNDESESETELEDLSAIDTRRHVTTSGQLPEVLSERFAALEPLKPSARPLDLPDHQREFYHSYFFTSLICWQHAAIIGISTTIFCYDAWDIGTTSTSNWWIVLVSFGSFTGLILVWTILAMPFSRVFR